MVDAGGVRLLVDAGLSARQLSRRLGLLGIEPESLDGILLTHEHGDHVSGLRVFLKSRDLPVYATPATCHVVREGVGPVRWKVFESGASFEIGGLRVESFPVPHDAVEPVGFVFRTQAGAMGLLSDTGHVTALITERLRGLPALFVEANYDDALLEADTRRPWSTKQRIASRHGHLSNAQTAALVAELAADGLRRVVLGHLSSDCNTPEVARSALREAGVEVDCAGQHEPTRWHPAVRPAAEPSGPAAEPAMEFGEDELFGALASRRAG